jgi:hypothetical protein
MRMVGLPRCHGKLGAKWVEVIPTCRETTGQSASRERLKRGQQQPRSFAPRLSLLPAPWLASHSKNKRSEVRGQRSVRSRKAKIDDGIKEVSELRPGHQDSRLTSSL